MDVEKIISGLNTVNQYTTTDSSTSTVVNPAEPSSDLQENNKKENDNSIKSDNKKDIKEAIDKLNKLLEKDNTHVEYSEYKKLGKTLVKIVDDKTNKTVMEIPDEKVLDVIASILENSGLIDKKA